MPNLVFLTQPFLQILDKTQAGVFPISRFLVKFLQDKNCHNSRTSNHIDMKFESLTKLDNRNTTPSKKVDVGIVFANYDVIIING